MEEVSSFPCASFIILTLSSLQYIRLSFYIIQLQLFYHPLSSTVLLKFDAFYTLLLWYSNWVDTHICLPLRHSWTCFEVAYTLEPLIIYQWLMYLCIINTYRNIESLHLALDLIVFRIGHVVKTARRSVGSYRFIYLPTKRKQEHFMHIE